MSEDDVDDLLEEEPLGAKLDAIHGVLEEIRDRDSYAAVQAESRVTIPWDFFNMILLALILWRVWT